MDESNICSKIHTSPKGRKWACRSISQSCVCKTHDGWLTSPILHLAILCHWGIKDIDDTKGHWLDVTNHLLPQEWDTSKGQWQSSTTKGSSSTLCANSSYVIQERLLLTIPKVFDPPWSGLHHEGSPWKGVWKPLRGMIIGPQAHTNRVLLVYNAKGCPILHEGMWQVLALQQCHKAIVRTTHVDECLMAFRSMGSRHHGTLSNGNVTTQVPYCWDWLLHQIGRSRTTGNHHGEKCL